jgi:hypothetical protein
MQQAVPQQRPSGVPQQHFFTTDWAANVNGPEHVLATLKLKASEKIKNGRKM